VSDRVADYVAGFNAAVGSGEWAPWSDRLTEDAVMEFVGVPVGPFVGREAVLAAYREEPPDDTLVVEQVATDGDVDVVDFVWSRGGRGVLVLTWRAGLVASLTVELR
jgi:steroid Delta-isomerase